MENIQADPLPCEAMQDEEEIFLIKKSGVWHMDHYKNGMVHTAVGKDLVFALMDAENPCAAAFVDVAVLGSDYPSLYVKYNADENIKKHECFDISIEDIKNILNNDGLVLAFSPTPLAVTPKLIQYAAEHGITLPR